MAQEVLLAKDSLWPSDALVFDFSFTGSANNDTAAKPPKQLACVRCHAQKLKCVRQISYGCVRCISANVGCVSRHHQRLGRPTDRSVDGNEQHRRGATRRPANARQRHDSTNDEPSKWHQRKSTRKTIADRLALNEIAPIVDLPTTTSMSVSMPITTPPPIPFRAPSFENWLWPSSQGAVAMTSAVTTSATSNSSTLGPNETLESQPRSTTFISDLSGYPLPNLDDIFNEGFNLSCASDKEPLSGETNLDDPIEVLTVVHLRLYQCLNVVKNVEKAKKARLNGIATEFNNFHRPRLVRTRLPNRGTIHRSSWELC
jgi:hypothetical protein